MQIIKIDAFQSNQRLDVFVSKILAQLSRNYVQKLISEGKILINNNHVKFGYKLKVGDILSIEFDENIAQIIPKIEIPIVYEDDNCIVLIKPVGILTHSKGNFNSEATVESFIKDKLVGLDGDRAGIVHRLDRATSGVMICAKNQTALNWLQDQFAKHKTIKTYIAIINNGISPKKALIDMPIERDPKSPKQFRVGLKGKPSQTKYEVIKSNQRYSLLELSPKTGRTHQLRVHLMQAGYPIIGDSLYGGEPASRMMLHSFKLELTLPNKEHKIFESSLPIEFDNILKS